MGMSCSIRLWKPGVYVLRQSNIELLTIWRYQSIVLENSSAYCSVFAFSSQEKSWFISYTFNPLNMLNNMVLNTMKVITT